MLAHAVCFATPKHVIKVSTIHGSLTRLIIRASGDFCHRRRIKCQSSTLDPSLCQNCTDFGLRCSYSRPSKRGTSSLHATAAPPTQQRQQRQQPSVTDSSRPGNPARGTTAPLISHEPGVDRGRFNQGEETSSTTAEGGWTEPLSPAWQGFARTSTPAIRSLLSVYHETVYPM